MAFARTFIGALMICAFSLAACNAHRNEGPAERAGEKIDSGMSKMGEKMKEGGRELQEKAHGE